MSSPASEPQQAADARALVNAARRARECFAALRGGMDCALVSTYTGTLVGALRKLAPVYRAMGRADVAALLETDAALWSEIGSEADATAQRLLDESGEPLPVESYADEIHPDVEGLVGELAEMDPERMAREEATRSAPVGLVLEYAVDAVQAGALHPVDAERAKAADAATKAQALIESLAEGVRGSEADDVLFDLSREFHAGAVSARALGMDGHADLLDRQAADANEAALIVRARDFAESRPDWPFERDAETSARIDRAHKLFGPTPLERQRLRFSMDAATEGVLRELAAEEIEVPTAFLDWLRPGLSNGVKHSQAAAADESLGLVKRSWHLANAIAYQAQAIVVARCLGVGRRKVASMRAEQRRLEHRHLELAARNHLERNAKSRRRAPWYIRSHVRELERRERRREHARPDRCARAPRPSTTRVQGSRRSLARALARCHSPPGSDDGPSSEPPSTRRRAGAFDQDRSIRAGRERSAQRSGGVHHQVAGLHKRNAPDLCRGPGRNRRGRRDGKAARDARIITDPRAAFATAIARVSGGLYAFIGKGVPASRAHLGGARGRS